MAYTTQYIGSRYVPLFAEPAEWDSTRTYEPLTIVLHGGNSYTSRQFVPVGVDINNADFWLETGNYNAQVEQYREETQSYAMQMKHAIRIYFNVNDMKKDTNLSIGNIVQTLYYTSPDFNGGGYYIITNTGIANNMDIIQLENGLLAQLVYENYYKISQFGANNTINDCASILQYLVDKSANTQIPVLIDTQIVIRTSIVLSSNIRFSIFGTNDFDILIKCYTNLFIGQNIAEQITPVYINMQNLYIDFLPTGAYSVFKGISLKSSQIYDSKFYHFAYFIEGSCSITRIERCRFQSYKYAVFSSYTFNENDPNNLNMNYVQNYLTNGGNIEKCTAIYNYVGKISDGFFISDCYISALENNTNNKPCVVFTVNDIDRDTVFSRCWIEFIYYFLRGSNLSTTVYGCTIDNCTIQYCVNLIQPAKNINKFNIYNCNFDAFERNAYTSRLGDVDSSEIFAVLCANKQYSNQSFTDINFINNEIRNVTYAIYFDQLGNSPAFIVNEKGTNTVTEYSGSSDLYNYFYINYFAVIDNNNSPFIRSKIESLNTLYFASQNELPNLEEKSPHLVNIFANTLFVTPNNLYKVVPTKSYGIFKYVVINTTIS